jgi:1-acyl-sn-glycerol-3-phosphate acyltransferase
MLSTSHTPPPEPVSPVLAVWRLMRLVVHMLHGMWVVTFRLRGGDADRRHAAIQWWSAKSLQVLGVQAQPQGIPRPGASLLVANHVSWLDIAAIHSVCPRARFVAKTEVKNWPLMGWLAERTGTLFIERGSKRDALRVVHHMAELMREGETIALFPEGTTSRGENLLPFHANLLQAAIATEVPVQPAAVRYTQPGLRNSPAAEFVDDMTLIQSLWAVARARELTVRVSFLTSEGSRHADRRALAEHVRSVIASHLAGEDLIDTPQAVERAAA